MINELEDEEKEIAAFEAATMELFDSLFYNIKTLKEEFDVSKEFVDQYIIAKLLDTSVKMSINIGVTKKLYYKMYKEIWDNNNPDLKDKIIDRTSVEIH